MRGNVSDRANDPAFIYFPTNYRWSMGLLLCLSAASSGGAEIDEVNRIGRALKDMTLTAQIYDRASALRAFRTRIATQNPREFCSITALCGADDDGWRR